MLQVLLGNLFMLITYRNLARGFAKICVEVDAFAGLPLCLRVLICLYLQGLLFPPGFGIHGSLLSVIPVMFLVTKVVKLRRFQWSLDNKCGLQSLPYLVLLVPLLPI